MIRSYRKGKVPVTKIQIFGERCSGTNYLEALLKENIRPDILTWEFGWKHWFCKDIYRGHPECLFLVIYRHPFSWLRSLHRKPWHAGPELRGLSFYRFLRREWYSVYDEDSDIKPGEPLWYTEIPGDLDPETGGHFRNVVALRNAKVRHFEAIKERFDNVCYLRYEDLQAEPEKMLRAIAAEYSLPLKADFQPVTAYKGVGGNYQPRSYRGIGLLNRLFILSKLDRAQEATIGYRV